MWEVWTSCPNMQKQRKAKERDDSREQIQSIEESSDAVWSKGGEKTRDSKRGSEMFWIWGKGTQEVGVSKNEREKERGSSTTMQIVKESERALWSEGAASKGSSNMYGRVDNTQKSCNTCGVLGM